MIHTAETDAIIVAHWITHSTTEIARMIGATKGTVSGRIRRLGLQGKSNSIPNSSAWTEQEIARLRTNHRNTARAIAHLFPGRSVKAIEGKRLDLVRQGSLAKVERKVSEPKPEAKRKVRRRYKMLIVSPHCCQWLDGERGAFVQCDAPAIRMYSDRPAVWCQTHFNIVYRSDA